MKLAVISSFFMDVPVKRRFVEGIDSPAALLRIIGTRFQYHLLFIHTDFSVGLLHSLFNSN